MCGAEVHEAMHRMTGRRALRVRTVSVPPQEETPQNSAQGGTHEYRNFRIGEVLCGAEREVCDE